MTDVVSDVCANLAAEGRQIEGMNAEGVFDPPRANLETAHLPALYTLTGNATHTGELGEMDAYTSRRFNIQVAVIPTGQGDPNTREAQCRPLLEQTLKHYRAYALTARIDWVSEIKIVSDSGIVILPEYGGKFIGFQISLDVKYNQPIE